MKIEGHTALIIFFVIIALIFFFGLQFSGLMTKTNSAPNTYYIDWPCRGAIEDVAIFNIDPRGDTTACIAHSNKGRTGYPEFFDASKWEFDDELSDYSCWGDTASDPCPFTVTRVYGTSPLCVEYSAPVSGSYFGLRIKAVVNSLDHSCQPCNPIPEICDNNFDDDCDGLLDTADPDCVIPPPQPWWQKIWNWILQILKEVFGK